MDSPDEFEQMTDREFQQRVFALIVRDFGLGGLARFIRTSSSGRGDYTAERQKWQTGLTVADVIHEMESQSNGG